MKLMQSEYGVFLYLLPLFQLGKNVFYFSGCVAGSAIAWQFIKQGHLTQPVYEQLAIIVSFLCFFLFKREKQYALVPYITKLTISKIRNYVLARELFSEFNFILFALVVPLRFLSDAITIESASPTYLFITLWLMGLCLNVLTRIIKYYCIRYKLFFIATFSIAFVYGIILVLFYRTTIGFSYLDIFDGSYYIFGLVTGIILLLPGYFHVIKQELYQVYEGNHLKHKTIHYFNPRLIPSSIFNKIMLLKYLRCSVFKKFPVLLISYVMAGIGFFLIFDQKQLGLGMFLSTYTFVMLPFTIYLSSNYFDGLYTKPISIKLLLFNSFYIHIITTTLLFLILLIFVMMYEKSNLLPLISFYCYVSGPMALLLLHNILFAQRFDLFPVRPDFTIQRTFAQNLIGFISAVSLWVCAAMIHFFSTIGCYVILSISIITIMTHSYGINYLYEKFMERKYRIMENLRKN
jgi:hypothetical protein